MLETLASDSGAAILYVHHHAKGGQGKKNSIDRASGSGVFGRFGDAIIDVAELHPDDEDSELFRVDFKLRAFEHKKSFGIRIKGLEITLEKSADLSDIKKPGVESTKHTEREITTLLLENSYKTADLIKAVKAEYGMKESTFYTLWRKVRKNDGVTENDKGEWSYVPPATNPPRIPNPATS